MDVKMTKDEFIKELEAQAVFHRDYSVNSGMNKETVMYYGVLRGANWAYDKLQGEIDRLKKIIAQCPNENDDLGAEYTHVLILKDEIDLLRKQVSIAYFAIEDAIDESDCGEVSDFNLREAFKAMREIEAQSFLESSEGEAE